MKRGTMRVLAIAGVVVLGVAAAACGEDDDTAEDVDDPIEEVVDDDGENGEDDNGRTLTVTPDNGLSDGDVVTLEAEGFSPGISVGITQCADEDDPAHGVEMTGQEHCDLGAIQTFEIEPDGTATAEYAVSSGPFGEAQVLCDADHDCVLSVGELSPDPDVERATATITFG